jgi:hypothetical protein
MLGKKADIFPRSGPNEEPMGFYAPVRTELPQKTSGQENKGDPSRRILEESTPEELEYQIQQPLRLTLIDIHGIVTQSITVLSAMSSELGVALRMKIRGDSVPTLADLENIRRSINALMIYLLTLSQSQGCVTADVEESFRGGKRGTSVRLSANNVVVPWKPNLETEAGVPEPQEISACRRILERNGGNLSVQSEEEQGLAFIVWIAVEGPGRK